MSIISKFSDMLSGDDVKAATEETKYALEILKEMGNAKGQYFEQSIAELIRTAGTAENATVPIESIIAMEKEVYVMDSVDSKKISETVQSIVDVISSEGQTDTKSVATMVGKVVGGLLGDSSGSDREKTKYIVYAEGLSVVRLDMHVWVWETKASSLLRSHLQRMVVLSLFKSTVDLSKIKLNTFLALYGHQLEGKDGLEKIVQHVANVKTIYSQFHDQPSK